MDAPEPTIKTLLATMNAKRDEALTSSEEDQLTRAFTFSKKAHEGQERANGEPFFHHVFATAHMTAELGMGPATVTAALLHDIIEDTDVTEENVKKDFGDEVLFLVNAVTKLGKLKYRGQERHVESLRKFFIASAEDLRVVVIKLSDRLHNLRTLDGLSDRPDKQKRIALESIEIYAPLAHRLGIGRLKGEIEDLAFPYAYPKEHAMTEELLKQKKKITQKYLEKVYKSLHKEVAKQGLSIIKTDYRIKHKYSLYKKLLRKDMDIDKVYDIVALRVIVKSIEDCYRLLGIIHSTWRPLPGRIKDYIAAPKPNGYQSLHTTIFTGDGGIAEIQIRTQKMHDIAEFGFASHASYKEHGSNYQDIVGTSWVEELKNLKDDNVRTKDVLKALREDYFRDRIFVFTPEGDVIDLPEGSSCIDFAYTIHSEIGNTAIGAKVNGKFVALKTKLTNGDIVDIETKEGNEPSSKWLDHAKTTLARRHIQRAIKDQSLFDRFIKRR